MPHISSRAEMLLRSSVVWDNHTCLPLRLDEEFLPRLERCRQAGATVVSVNVGFGQMSWAEHLQIISFLRQWIGSQPQTYQLLHTVEDVHRCKAAGRLGIVFDVEGMGPVVEDPARVQTFYDLGVRWMLIAYNRNNAAGGGCLDADGGLTARGREIIDQMERIGMVLCLSHAGARTAMDAIEYTRNPVIFSHSNPYAVTPHERNVSDALLVACARRGGVIGLSGFGPFLGGGSHVLDAYLNQLRYLIDRVGAEHVGLGLDYVFDRSELDAYVAQDPALFPASMGISSGVSMVEPEAIVEIAEALTRDNLTDAQIRGILGENWLRVATQVWR